MRTRVINEVHYVRLFLYESYINRLSADQMNSFGYLCFIRMVLCTDSNAFV